MKRLELKCRGCCQTVLLDPDTVILHHDPEHSRGTYAYQCPSCGEARRMEALGPGVRLLLAAGVRADQHAGGPPLTHDDLLDFINALRDL